MKTYLATTHVSFEFEILGESPESAKEIAIMDLSRMFDSNKINASISPALIKVRELKQRVNP